MKFKIERKWDGSFEIFSIEQFNSEFTVKWNFKFEQELIKNESFGSDIKPSFRIGPLRGDMMMKALADAIIEAGLVKSPDSTLDGELKATKHHLEDMQRLVFEPMNERIVIDE